MPGAAPREWTQIDLTSHRGVWGQRVTAGLLVASGMIGFTVTLPYLSAWWWEVILLGFGCLLIVVLGIGIWINAGVSGGATVELKASGVPVRLPVVAAYETTDEAVRYQLQLRIPESAGEGDDVVHSCGYHGCVAAGREAPNSDLPVLMDVKTRTWGVIHGSNVS